MERRIVTNGDSWRSCAKVCEVTELPFAVVSGMGPGTGVLMGVDMPQNEGEVLMPKGKF